MTEINPDIEQAEADAQHKRAAADNAVKQLAGLRAANVPPRNLELYEAVTNGRVKAAEEAEARLQQMREAASVA